MLKEAGFKNVIIEPINIYTRDIISDLMLDDETPIKSSLRDESFLDSMDGAFAGAHVKAEK